MPEDMTGRAMTDMERHGRTCKSTGGCSAEEQCAVLTGSVPVAYYAEIMQKEVTAYTKGRRYLISCTLKGYEPCHNTEEVAGRHRL